MRSVRPATRSGRNTGLQTLATALSTAAAALILSAAPAAPVACTTAAALVLASASTAAATPTPGNTHFPRYKELEPNVAFWSDAFTKWTSHQIAFHDVEHLELVYSVLSIDDIVARLPEGQVDAAIQARRKAEGERISAMLVSISEGHARTEEERRILKAIAKIGYEPSYAMTLSEQVRSQRGLGDKFCDAAARAQAYRPMMSEILQRYDVPQELLALPLVESGYKIGARSSAGASGIWQFMPATGRLYLEVNGSYDDRRDPRRSTEAAAKMLRKTYENLGSWPLAITSYNHGPGGIARAVKDMGTTHFGVISSHYKGKSFGFASRNYYAEFLAAVDAMNRVPELCGQISAPTYQPDEAMISTSASIRDLARAARTSVDQLADLNPALSDGVLRGSAKVPRGYRVNLPHGTRSEFEVAFGHVDHSSPSAPDIIARDSGGSSASASAETVEAEASPPPSKPIIHRVTRDETLGQIARRFGTTETTLLYMNNLRNASAMKVGMNLKVPADRVTTPVAIAAAQVEHPPMSRNMTTNAGIMAASQAGQAAALAARTAVAAVPAAVIQKDDVTKPDSPAVVRVEPAVIASVPKEAPPAASASPAAATAKASPANDKNDDGQAEPELTAEHKVGRGQTLVQIASMYHTTVDDLMKRNGITDPTSIQSGQTLKVRASGSEIVSGSTVGRTYKVRSGDTLSKVALANDTSVETLKRLNPKIASEGLKAGRTIKVPSAGAVAVASAARNDDDDDMPRSASTSRGKSASAASAKTASAKSTKTSAKSSSKTAVSKSSSKSAAKVASSSSSRSSFRSHRVQKGQTLTSIAQKYRTSVDTLKRINGIRDAHNVQVGKTIKVPL
ncbi:MAG TPA: LysM peptidoglycan-binding domain-containing protein [Candidatus Limnocylindrales bacterium]|nr:LysM peptidoglycan-binding domain-containing protein [Candidatus Limnocylindrales bacterium]